MAVASGMDRQAVLPSVVHVKVPVSCSRPGCDVCWVDVEESCVLLSERHRRRGCRGRWHVLVFLAL